jgi:hypothetical protein
MPRSSELTFTCPCGSDFTTTIYQVVNVTLEPRLLYRLLEGLLNVAVCPNCGRTAEAGQGYFYHDMGRGLFAYVHQSGELPEEERDGLLERLRSVYATAVEESERIVRQRARAGGAVEQPRLTVRRMRPYDDIGARLEPEAPPMQVIFGAGQLVALVDSLLEPGEKLGRVALATRSADPVVRDRLLRIAGEMAMQMECETRVEDAPDEYSVWIFGPRAKVDAIARAIGRTA